MNTGAFLGAFKGTNYLLAALSLIVLAFVIFYYNKLPKERYTMVSLALITGGLVANAIDRIFLGGVVNFIDIGFWPSFNLADSAVTAGIIGVILCHFSLIKRMKKFKRRNI